jgi:four helix bundle protein
MPLAHERLDAYRLARQFALELFQQTAAFPAEERFGLTSQIRRAAVSILANIAEGAARRSKKEFIQFLSMARGSSSELRVLLEIAKGTGYLDEGSFKLDEEMVNRISSMLSGLIRRNSSQ